MNTISQAQFQKNPDEVSGYSRLLEFSYVRRKKLPKTTKCILSTPHLKGAIEPASALCAEVALLTRGSHNI